MRRGIRWACAAAAVGAGFAFAPTAQAITLKEAFSVAFQDPQSPIIMEDDDFQVFVDTDQNGLDAGDQIFGVFHAQAISASGLNTPPSTIKSANDVVSGNPADRTVLGDGSSGNNTLNAIFGVEIVAVVPNVIVGPAGPVAVIDVIVGPTGGATWTFPGGATYVKSDADTVVDLYEDGPGLAGTAQNAGASFATAVSTYTDGVFLAGFGFTLPPAIGANAEGEYFFNRDTTGDGIPDSFELNLNFVAFNGAYGDNPFDGVLPNDVTGPTVAPTYGNPFNYGLGAALFGGGQLFPGFTTTSGDVWTATSDGNFSVLVPTPAAVGPALLGLGLLAVRRKRRTA